MTQKKTIGRVTAIFPDGIDVVMREATLEESERFVRDFLADASMGLKLKKAFIILRMFLLGLAIGLVVGSL